MCVVFPANVVRVPEFTREKHSSSTTDQSQPAKTNHQSSSRIHPKNLPRTITTVNTSQPRSPPHAAMASLTHTSRTLLRTIPRSNSLAVRALSTSAAKRDAPTSSFDSPFRGMGNDAGSKIPDFSNYRSKSGTNSNLLFQYFMVGTMGALTAAGAKATVQGTLLQEANWIGSHGKGFGSYGMMGIYQLGYGADN